MKIMVLSDSHLGHERLKVMGRGRPDDFTEQILRNIAAGTGDLLIHCGDVAMGREKYWHEQFIKAASGFKKKILVLGNHDGKSCEWYERIGWDFVCENVNTTYFGKRILFTHIPQIRNDIKFTASFPIDYNIHGHLHGRFNPHVPVEIYDPKFNIDVAVDDYGYAPVDLEKLIKKYLRIK